MKIRISLLALLLIFPVLLFAENVSQERAMEKAREFFGYATKSAANNDLRLVWNGESSQTKASTAPAFYVFGKQGGGFVIISGDDCISPILGYSTTNDFTTDGMPENVASWFAGYKSFINECRSKSIVDPNAATAWQNKAPYRPALASNVKLVTAQWGQSSPFNLYTPDGCPCGCVATAMAIVMRYYMYPAAGKGTIPGYTTGTNSYSIPTNALGTPYNWDIMPLDAKNVSSEVADQLSRLTYDCGTSVKMDYDKDGSAAYVNDIGPALIKYFGFDKSLTFNYAKDFSAEEWTASLKKDLDAGHPIMYGGNDVKNGGHRFIVDGYDETGYFSINFGWFGNNNGYFAFPNFGEFVSNHNALFNVKPDAGGTYEEVLRIQEQNKGDIGLTTNAPVFVDNITFELTISGIIYNIGTASYQGAIAVARCDSNGKILEQICTAQETTNLSYGQGYVGVTFTNCTLKTFNDNDRLAVIYHTSDGQWKPVLYDKSNGSFRGEIVLKHGESVCPLADATSLSYDPSNMRITVKTNAEATATLKDASGADQSSAMTVSSGTITINTPSLKKGNYSLRIEVENYGSYTIQIRAGK